MIKVPLFVLTFLTLLSYGVTVYGQETPRLPPPTGPRNIGTVEVQLTDNSRTDPFAPDPTAPRTFMVQIFYPTWQNSPDIFPPRAKYMPPVAAIIQELLNGFPLGSLSSLETNSHRGAPIQLQNNTAKVVLFSPGFPISRIFYTSMAEELASQGFVVIAIDHTYEAHAVEFPDGTVIISSFITHLDPKLNAGPTIKAFDARTKDSYFVIDSILDLIAKIPGASNDITIGGIGMYGHSFGGATAAEVALFDDRVLGGINMDGEFWGNVVLEGLDKPFFIMGLGGLNTTTTSTNPSWKIMWENLHGWKRHVQLVGAKHMGYSDFPVLYKIFDLIHLFPAGVFEQNYGTIEPLRAATIQKTYVATFFNLLLGAVESGRMDGPDPAFPEIIFPSEI